MANQQDFRVKNGLVVGGNTFVTAVGNSSNRGTTYTSGQFRLNTDTGAFETYYSVAAGSAWLSVTSSVIFPTGDLGNLSQDYTPFGVETGYARVYDCSLFPVGSISTFDLNT
jgi:hypothetical protein